MKPLEKLTNDQYRSFLKLYRFHLNRLYKESFFLDYFMKPFKKWFAKFDTPQNAGKLALLLKSYKVIMIGTISFFVLLMFNLTQTQALYILAGIAWLPFTLLNSGFVLQRMTLHGGDMIMHHLGPDRKRFVYDRVQEQFWLSFLTTYLPITLFTALRLSIEQRQLWLVPLFLAFQFILFLISRWAVWFLILFHIQSKRHGFIRSLIYEVFALGVIILTYFVPLVPLFSLFQNAFESTLGVFILVGYWSLVSVFLLFAFNATLKRWLSIHHTTLFSLQRPKNASIRTLKSLHPDSLLLTGLNEIERAVLIKDLKTMKRMDSNTFYALLLFGVLLIFNLSRYWETLTQNESVIDLLGSSLLFAASASLFHMMVVAFSSKKVSYRAEGPMVRLYHILEFPKAQIFRAKVRLYQLITLSISIIFVIVNLSLFLFPSVQHLLIFILSLSFYFGFTRLKLRFFVSSDLYGYGSKNPSTMAPVSDAGVIAFMFILMIGLILGVTEFTRNLETEFGLNASLLFIGFISMLFIIANIVYDKKLQQKQRQEVSA